MLPIYRYKLQTTSQLSQVSQRQWTDFLIEKILNYILAISGSASANSNLASTTLSIVTSIVK